MTTPAQTFADNARTAPHLLMFCGILGVIGSLAPCAAMVWASLVTDHSFLADTVSDLGRGPNRFIMDTGFYINAASLIALAIGSTLLHPGSKRWTILVLCFTCLALLIVAIGLWDDFGQTAPDGGMSVHTKLTFGLGPLYLGGPLLAASILRDSEPGKAKLFVAAAILWILFAAAFKLAPDGIDGGLEKIAIAATLLWTVPFAWWMLALARQEA